MEIEVVGCGVNPQEKTFSPSKRDKPATYLVWEDLTVVLPNVGNGSTRKLLRDISGHAEPGRIMAIMGPSGSGKSTLLDSLAGRLSRNVIMTGNVFLNGKKRKLEYGVSAYVTQEDVLLGTLTVKETIAYTAHLRFPETMSKKEINGLVEGTIMEMGLEDCRDRTIGNWHLRGISGGEKKRLSIALEIITRPSLLFLDEPTSGLDSAAAFFVIQILRNIAEGEKAVIFSIHQPSSEVFELFDDLFLLSGGEAVYFGEAKMALEFFSEAGFPCPTRRNPTDHFIRCINSEFDIVNATLMGSHRICKSETSSDPLMNLAATKIKRILVENYKHSMYAKSARTRIREILLLDQPWMKSYCGSEASWRKQLFILTHRSFKNMNRDVSYYWLRIVIYILVSICVGTIYFDVGHGYASIWARAASGGFVTGFMTFMSIGGFPCFIEEMKVFHRENLNGHYGVAVFTISNFISALPFLVLASLLCGTITFFMVKVRSGFSYYLFYTLDIFGCIAVVESCMMVVATLVPNYMMGIIAGAGILGIMMLTSGFFQVLSKIPKPFWHYPLYYISYTSWAIQGAYKNELVGLEFDPLIPGEPKLKGEVVIQAMFGIPLGHSKWWDLSAVAIILIAYRLLFFAILKFKERASTLFHKLYTKRTLHHLKKMASFKKHPSISSKRHPNLHPLSSQEGLSSPLP